MTRVTNRCNVYKRARTLPARQNPSPRSPPLRNSACRVLLWGAFPDLPGPRQRPSTRGKVSSSPSSVRALFTNHCPCTFTCLLLPLCRCREQTFNNWRGRKIQSKKCNSTPNSLGWLQWTCTFIVPMCDVENTVTYKGRTLKKKKKKDVYVT